MVGFSNDEPASYVILQRDINPTAQDVLLGIDDVHIEIGDQGNSHYGALDSCLLTKDKLTLKLSDVGARALGVSQVIEIDFTVDPHDLSDLQKALQIICNGKVEFLVVI